MEANVPYKKFNREEVVPVYRFNEIYKKGEEKKMAIGIRRIVFSRSEIACFDTDAENCFTPICPDELPVPGGTEIVKELNDQAELGDFRIASKDGHPENAIWRATRKDPQFSPVEGEHVDMRWNMHGVPGTKGFELIDGLPHISKYQFIIYKGVEKDMHPYGACYHDPAEKISTGVIEFLKYKGVKVVIVGGLATDYCVKLTVLQLLRAGFIVILNLGACRGIAEDTTKAAIEEMRNSGAIIVENTAEIIEKMSV